MNIGPLLRNMLGNIKSGEPRSLELKAGQVVRGTVLSVSDDGQEAVIQVQGVKLHAALETPLKQGQTTLLQVQPQNENGLTMLKPINSPTTAPLSAASLASALEALGLDNTASNRELIQLMRESGIPLTKENVNQLIALSGNRASSIPLGEWIQAAGIAMGRGLPMTGETVAGLHQAIYGPPLHVLLSSLEEQLTTVFRQALSNPANPGSNGTGTPNPNAMNTQLQNSGIVLQQGGSPQLAQTGPNVSGGLTKPMNTTPGTIQTTSLSNGSSALPTGSASLVGNTGEALLLKLQSVLSDVRSAMMQESQQAGLKQGTGSTVAAAVNGQAASKGNMTGASPTLQTGVHVMQAGEGAAGTSPQQAQGQAQGQAPAPGGPTQGMESWVGRVLKLLGAEHEQQVLRAAPSGGPAAQTAQAAPATAPAASAGASTPAPAPSGSVPTAAPVNAPTPPQGGDVGATQPGAAIAAAGGDKAAAQPALSTAAALMKGAPEGVVGNHSAHDTLKGLLLQIVAADDMPAPLQDAARQLVQQLTGQQLLLNTDRTAPFAQVTMFLPFIGPDGEQTAAVHIESRRGRKGELDPSNCRLWFDLQMKTLGQIMVDVQVADKKVLLKLYSEQEMTGLFLESRQEEISEALDASGYKLLSMRSELLIPNETEEGTSNSSHDLGMSNSYAPSTYKGVDYRV